MNDTRINKQAHIDQLQAVVQELGISPDDLTRTIYARELAKRVQTGTISTQVLRTACSRLITRHPEIIKGD